MAISTEASRKDNSRSRLAPHSAGTISGVLLSAQARPPDAVISFLDGSRRQGEPHRPASANTNTHCRGAQSVRLGPGQAIELGSRYPRRHMDNDSTGRPGMLNEL